MPATVHLTPRAPHRALAGHPWIYRNEIGRIDGATAPGDVVEVRDARGDLVGTGYHNEKSMIAVRLLARGARAIDAAFWRDRLRAAIAYRAEVMPDAEACRLVNSEADLLPGLIVDRYGDQLVFQLTTAGMERQRDAIVAALAELVPARAVIERSDVPVRKLEGLPERKQVVSGASDGRVALKIGDARFAFDLLDPHKTGFYLDQSRNYRRVAARVRDRMRVVDAFCHLGGFAVHAALAGAGEVVAIDQAEASIAGARAAAELNGVAPRVRFATANAFDWLKQAEAAGERYDLIVLDPPSFTRTRDAVPGALRGYKEIHLRALRMLPSAGWLATFCCSHHVDERTFLGAVLAAAADAKKVVRLEERLGAAPDHPVLPAVPETEYLKGFVLRVLDA